jgi:dystrophin
MSDFVKLMKNKFKSRRYRSRPPKKLGYLPVQTIMEGTNIETPSLPPTDMNFGYSIDGSASPGSNRYHMDDMNEEHRLIQQMCQTLNNEHNASLLVPKSPSQILKSLAIESDDKQDIDELICGLEEEHQALLSEYNRLKGIQANEETLYPVTSDTGRDAELIAEAKVLRQHKGRLESRMQTLEDHNRQLEAQLQRLRQLLEQPPSERERVNMNMHTPSSSSSRVTPALTPSSSYHGTPEPERRDPPIPNGYSNDNIADFHTVTSQIEHAFPVE